MPRGKATAPAAPPAPAAPRGRRGRNVGQTADVQQVQAPIAQRASSRKATPSKKRRTDDYAPALAPVRVQHSSDTVINGAETNDSAATTLATGGPHSTDTSTIVAEVLKQLQEGGFLLKPVPSGPAATATATAVPAGTLGKVEATGLGVETLDATLASMLQGESQPRVNSSPPYSGPSLSIPLGQHVSIKLKTKIWGREYIELAELNGDQPEPKLAVTFTQNDGSSPSVAMVSQPKTRAITTFAQWQSAYNTFVAIHAERFPLETPQMMKYAETIRELANKYTGPAWLRYDQQFRQARQAIPLNWAELHLELYVKCITLYGAAPAASQTHMQLPNANRNLPFRIDPLWAM